MQQLTSVRAINSAIDLQTYKGTRRVWVGDQDRVFRARSRGGQLQAKVSDGDGGTKWINVNAINVD